MKIKYQIYLTLICILWFSVSCQATVTDLSEAVQTSTMQPDLAIIPVTKTMSDEIVAFPSPTPFICTPLLGEISLDLNPLSSTLVEIMVQGLQPNQEITVVFAAESPNHKKTIEDREVLIGSDGQYVARQTLTPISDNGENHWMVSIIHADGIACAEITLTP